MFLQPGLPFPGGVDYALNLAFTFVSAPSLVLSHSISSTLYQNAGNFYVNGATFVPPSVPTLLQIFSGARTAQDLPSGTLYTLPSNATIEITMPGVLGGDHPMHLHGVCLSLFVMLLTDLYPCSTISGLYKALEVSQIISTQLSVTLSTLAVLVTTLQFVSRYDDIWNRMYK